ncbi:thrombospondin type-1 domain-containing protein [Nesterenkonia alkaliphila]
MAADFASCSSQCGPGLSARRIQCPDPGCLPFAATGCAFGRSAEPRR